ncbi:7-deoxyloganetin glucosyltransferase-like [Curcuma longa]|uniref:7-deoxyloganetin glucosyltransferase-like n=1 Tax=Curcuma longa TaxID=136217 RepID=UPI003D9F8EBE
MTNGKPHAVCFPLPAQGHINAMLHFANALHFMGFHITFVNTDFNHRRIVRKDGSACLYGLPDFRFATIPDGLSYPDDDIDRSQDLIAVGLSIKRHGVAPLRDLITALNDPCSGGPRVSCMISDAFATFTLAVTAELSIPNIFFCSASPAGYLGSFYVKELMQRNIIPLRSEEDLTNSFLDTVIDWIPGMPNIRLKDLPSFIRTTNPHDIMLNYCWEETHASRDASAIIFNTFHDLDTPVIEALSSVLPPPLYDIGPVSLLSQYIPDHNSLRVNLWKEDSNCIEWLYEKKQGSVLYVNFGSLAVLTSSQFIEFAWGLANSRCKFLWVTRPDLMEGETALLPAEIATEIKGRSFVTSWCPQREVLSHPAVGGFLTHCGWNSAMESISAGVPMICWPFLADQQPNCRYLCSEWGIGMEIGEEVKREEVARLIKELMEGQKGKEMKRKALEWKVRAVKAASLGGDSWIKLERVIKEVMMK